MPFASHISSTCRLKAIMAPNRVLLAFPRFGGLRAEGYPVVTVVAMSCALHLVKKERHMRAGQQ